MYTRALYKSLHVCAALEEEDEEIDNEIEIEE